jgi:DNA-binding LacI/PurR family transcriptional regulator
MPNITIRDVAKKAGVSVTIASFALNDVKGRVSHIVRERVLKCAEELKYTPNINARRLKTKDINTLLLVYSDVFLNERYASTIQFVASVLTYASERGKDVLVKLMKWDGFNYNHELRVYQEIWASKRVEGMIFECNLEDEQGDNFYKELNYSGVNFVNISRLGRADGYPCVYMDEYKILREVVEFIHNKGYKEIYYLTRNTNIPSQRELGYKDAVKDLNLTGYPLYYKNIYRTRDELWAILQPIVQKRKQRIAISCWNDVDAINVVEVLQANGVRIPEEVGVMGFDDIPSAEHLTPKLTTVSQPFDEMAYHALEVIRSAADRSSEQDLVAIQVSGKIIKRQSI